jgi:galactosamine-6-phosphate isomerase
MGAPGQGPSTVRIEIARDHEGMSRRAEAHIIRALRRNRGLLLGVATGDTPARTYERLARRGASEPVLFRRLRIVGLDEWLGLPARHPLTCASYIDRRILRPLGVARARSQGFNAMAKDHESEARRMSRWLSRNGPLDLCILGLGRNGHLLMNEPASELSPFAHVARLAPSTRRHPTLRGLKTAPRRGLTLGLGEILQSKAILLLVSGGHKRAALKRTLAGRASTRCPASLLWLHPDVTVCCDLAAVGEKA